MILIDFFPLLRAIRYVTEQSNYAHARKLLRVLIQHEKAYQQVVEPVQKGRSGGKESGVSRKKSAVRRRRLLLTEAHEAFVKLTAEHAYEMRNPTKAEIETAAGLPKNALRKISMDEIRKGKLRKKQRAKS